MVARSPTLLTTRPILKTFRIKPKTHKIQNHQITIIPLAPEGTIEYLDHICHDTHIRNGPTLSFPKALSLMNTDIWIETPSNEANPKSTITLSGFGLRVGSVIRLSIGSNVMYG